MLPCLTLIGSVKSFYGYWHHQSTPCVISNVQFYGYVQSEFVRVTHSGQSRPQGLARKSKTPPGTRKPWEAPSEKGAMVWFSLRFFTVFWHILRSAKMKYFRWPTNGRRGR